MLISKTVDTRPSEFISPSISNVDRLKEQKDFLKPLKKHGR